MTKKFRFILTLTTIITFSGATVYLCLEKNRLEKQITRLEVEIDAMKSGYSVIISGFEERFDGLDRAVESINYKETEESARYARYFEIMDKNLSDVKKKLAVKGNTNTEEEFSRRRTEKEESANKDTLRLNDVKLNNYYKEGLAAYNNNDFAKAETEFGKLIDLVPPVWEACLYYIQAAYYNNPGKAASDKHIGEMVTAIPDYLNKEGRVSKIKGLLALEQGNYETGLLHMKQSLSLNPGDTQLRNHIGMAAYAFKDYDNCITFLGERNSLPPECLYTLGRAYEMVPDTEAALKQFYLCVAADPGYYQAYNRIGILKKQEGFYEDAAAAFLQYHAYRKEAENMYLLGECYLSLDNEDKAFSLFKEIVSRFPESSRAEEVLYKLEQVR